MKIEHLGRARGRRAMVRQMRRLAGNHRGATAAVVALAMPMLAGAMSLGLDFSIYRMVQNRMQIAVDGAALAGAAQIERGGNVQQTALTQATRDLSGDYSGMTRASDITTGVYSRANGFVPGGGNNVNAVRVVGERSAGRGNSVTLIMASVLGFGPLPVRVTAIAARPANVFYQPPESESLDTEAGDFNEIYVYCFSTTGGGTPASRRSQMTLVANNLPANQNIVQISGNRITANPQRPPPWPNCNQEGQTLSIRLRNIRHVKSNPTLWANPNATISGVRPGRPEHNYYTDTQLQNWVERFDLQGFNILETVRCNTAAQCTPGSPTSIIPSGRNRQNTRRRENQPCEPGKFMYFGFEDRPPGQSGASSNWLQPAWTDTDYDDIRIVMRCPNSGRLGDANVRLVS
jgi:Flp pilus assembly protein TadG